VSSSGLITAVAAGSATIRATVETKFGDGTLTVTAPVTATTATVVATVDSSTLAPGHSAQGHAVAKDAQGNVLTGKTVSWSSNNTAIATVSATTGLVTAVSAGSALVQATIDGVGGQASVNVTVPSIITAPAPTSGTLATADFEDGTLGSYYNPWGTAIDVIADPTGSGHGKVSRMHYKAASLDDNKAIVPKTGFAVGLGDSIFFRGQFYLPPEINTDPNFGLRKLTYWSNASFKEEFSAIITLVGQELVVVSTVVGPSNLPIDYLYTPTMVSKGVWHTLETQIKVNSSFAAKDGIFRIWLDGALVYSRTDMRWTDPLWTEDPSTYKWEMWGVGYQVNASSAYDEYRYWDNVTFAKAKITP
jgi:hypothetical protein